MDVPPFNTYLGVEVARKNAGEAEASIDLAPHHLNRRGVAHGGVVTSLLDTALGAAVISAIPKEWWCATTSLSTQFVRGARPGRLVATGRVVRRAGAVAFATGEAEDEHGEIVATANGTWHLWSQRPGSRADGTALPFLPLRGSNERIRVGKILAVGRNYADHVREMGAPLDTPPVLFLKPATALVQDGANVVLPRDAGEIHHEVELVVVIGKPGRAIAADDALDHVLGFAVGLDLTLRDIQSEAKKRGEPWSVAKGFDGSAPVSSIVPRDEVGDGSGLEIRLEVNGRERQHGNTSQMIFPVPRLVALASRFITLERGDLLFTGTPAGVGPLHAGDRVRAHIDRLAELSITAE